MAASDLLSTLGGNLALGLATAVSLQNLFYCFVGVLLGTLIGVLPGIGPVATIAMLLPITYRAAADGRADHARRNLLRRAVRRIDDGDPGQPAGRSLLGRDRASTATRWPGRAGPGPALAIAAIGSFFAGTVCDADHCALLAAPLAAVATAVRAGGIFFADGARPDRRRRARQSARC